MLTNVEPKLMTALAEIIIAKTPQEALPAPAPMDIRWTQMMNAKVCRFQMHQKIKIIL